MDRPHDAVRHSTGGYVRVMVHTNGIESHWAMLKRGIVGTYHHISPRHLHRLRLNSRGCITPDLLTRLTRFGES
ncbi:MAG: transposase [Holophagales bacterium]|nr:transposase [Holophagales bacterium]